MDFKVLIIHTKVIAINSHDRSSNYQLHLQTMLNIFNAILLIMQLGLSQPLAR